MAKHYKSEHDDGDDYSNAYATSTPLPARTRRTRLNNEAALKNEILEAKKWLTVTLTRLDLD